LLLLLLLPPLGPFWTTFGCPAQERERLIFVSLKKTAAALAVMTDENSMLRHEIKELRGEEDDEEESDPEPPEPRNSEPAIDGLSSDESAEERP